LKADKSGLVLANEHEHEAEISHSVLGPGTALEASAHRLVLPRAFRLPRQLRRAALEHAEREETDKRGEAEHCMLRKPFPSLVASEANEDAACLACPLA
jgi:hypothetical protein